MKQNAKDTLFVAFHPVLALRTLSRQQLVAIEAAGPPHTSTWEEFPTLRLPDAMRAVRSARINNSGVPQNAWPKSDQERMARGQQPIGHPEHPNI